MYFPLRGSCAYIADFDLTWEFRASHTHQLYKEQPFGITWKNKLFLLFLNETLLASSRRLHQSPELLLSLDLFIFSSFVHGSVLFFFFVSYHWWANLPKTDWLWPECMRATETNLKFTLTSSWPNNLLTERFLTSINFHSTHSISHISILSNWKGGESYSVSLSPDLHHVSLLLREVIRKTYFFWGGGWGGENLGKKRYTQRRQVSPLMSSEVPFFVGPYLILVHYFNIPKTFFYFQRPPNSLFSNFP